MILEQRIGHRGLEDSSDGVCGQIQFCLAVRLGFSEWCGLSRGAVGAVGANPDVEMTEAVTGLPQS
ncbi:MAG: hypothetical protein VXW32_14405 [Myxococcota bacterium]|nr:hypothetical protein [Myxococcota bacterium]